MVFFLTVTFSIFYLFTDSSKQTQLKLKSHTGMILVKAPIANDSTHVLILIIITYRQLDSFLRSNTNKLRRKTSVESAKPFKS